MGLLAERQKMKSALEDEMLIGAFRELAGVVSDNTVHNEGAGESLIVLDAIRDLGNFLNIRIPTFPISNLSIESFQEEYLRPQGIMWRNVLLKEKWYEDAAGVMLGSFYDGTPVALIPSRNTGYTYKDPGTGKTIRITSENAGNFRREAVLYYKALPAGQIGMKDIMDFIRRCVSPSEVLRLIGASLIMILLSMITPLMTSYLVSGVAPNQDLKLLNVILVILIIVTAAVFLFTSIKQLLLARISTKVAVPLQSAFMMRVLTAPAGELRNFSAGDLGMKIGSMYNNLKMLLNVFLSMMLTAACSLICFFQMFRYAPGPAGVALAVTVGLIIIYVRAIIKQADVSADRMRAQAEESGLTYNILNGMQKISLSGSEKRAFAVWLRAYREAVQTLYNPPLFLKVFSVLTPVILLAGTIFMYLAAADAKVTQADFIAFFSSYGILTGALTTIGTNAVDFANALPVFQILKPVMDLEPENGAKKEIVKSLKGNISMQNVTFRYAGNMLPVLENLNLTINRGEYVAIVGTTGCGKTTIMRLLLGFEKPDYGDIFYDGKNLKALDETSLRRKIGTVLQSGEIFQGTIFSNITVSGTDLTEEDAWEAAEIAGIADDIRRMPLKMNTPLPDGGRGVSGGQKQRLLIARAIVSKPSVILFDEATSALDNVTQKAVSDAIGEMPCTRVVIAHRLSTIKNCDRILCLDKGHIVEEGTYEELISHNGFFSKLVNRQQI